MEKLFKIATFKEVDGKFEFAGFKEYKINFICPGTRGRLKIVVNGQITKYFIPMKGDYSMYKTRLLNAISDYENGRIKNTKPRVKFVHELHLKTHFKQAIIDRMHFYLDPLTKECNRDKLTKFNLISFNTDE